MTFDPYAKATGHLQGVCQYVAREIESIVRIFPMDEDAKIHLTEAAAKLIDASVKAEDIVSTVEAA